MAGVRCRQVAGVPACQVSVSPPTVMTSLETATSARDDRRRQYVIPDLCEPCRAEPSRAEPNQAVPSRAEPGRAEPSRAEYALRGAAGGSG